MKMFKSITFTICLFLLTNALYGQSEKTNLLVVFTDQHSYDMIGKINSQVKTPNLDQLADEGVLFKNTVVNYPLCTPMRGLVLTGMHPYYNGAWKNDAPLFTSEITGKETFAEILNAEGYNTAYIGKWHLNGGSRQDPILPGEWRHGFKTFLSDNTTTNFSADHSFYWADDGTKLYHSDKYANDPNPDERKPWQLIAQTKDAEGWLEEHYTNTPNDPFGLFLSWHPPHNFGGDGCEELDGKQGNYDPAQIDESLNNPYANVDVTLREDIELSRSLTNDEKNCIRKQYKGHMAMITACDAMVGRLIQGLKDRGVYDNTLIVFTADHGDMLSSHGTYMPKKAPHDYSVRVPLIMKGPTVPADGESNLLMGSIDLMPTILGLLNVRRVAQNDRHGIDASRFIENSRQNAIPYQPIFTLVGGNFRGVYTKNWTYSKSLISESGIDRPNQPENLQMNVLYNRNDDPGQLNNLYEDPSYSDIIDEMRLLTEEWVQRYDVGDYTIKDVKRIDVLKDVEAQKIYRGEQGTIIELLRNN